MDINMTNICKNFGHEVRMKFTKSSIECKMMIYVAFGCVIPTYGTQTNGL